MINKIIKVLLVMLMFVGLLYVGGYTPSEFAHKVQIKNPKVVFQPLIDDLPSLPVGNGGNNGNTVDIASNNDEITTSEIPTVNDDTLFNSSENEITIANNTEQSPDKIEISSKRSFAITINGNTFELSSTNTISFIKWINNNYTDNSKVICKEVTTESTTENVIEVEKSTESKEKVEVAFNEKLKSKDDLDTIIQSIKEIDKLPETGDYERSDYESPVKSYKINKSKYNRNDYSWKTSQFLKNEDPFEYICPYTDQTITNDSKLDYDHIVSLKTVEASCPDWWTDKEKNEYAYDQAVGVDVLYSANRSKGSKTPSEWLPDKNVEDYCYTYLLICSKYQLNMSDEDIDVCYSTISKAIKEKEPVTTLNTFIVK